MAILPDLLRVQLQSHFASQQQIRNTFHIAKPGAGIVLGPELTTIGNALDSLLVDPYRHMLTPLDFYDGLQVSQVRAAADPTTPIEEVSIPHVLIGTAAISRGLPTQITTVLRLKTGLASRRYRGRMFLPGPSYSGDLTGQGINLTSTWATSVKAFADVLAGGFDGAATPWTGDLSGWLISVYSRAADLASEAPTAAEVSAYQMDPLVHWLDSRGKGA